MTDAERELLLLNAAVTAGLVAGVREVHRIDMTGVVSITSGETAARDLVARIDRVRLERDPVPTQEDLIDQLARGERTDVR